MTKQDIRTSIKESKSKLSKSEILTYSKDISEQLYQSSAFQQCEQLFCYVNFNQEVVTSEVIETALAMKKKVAVPKIVGDEMKFYYIESLAALKPGILDILEPVITAKSTITDSTSIQEAIPSTDILNLFIVPGLAFDKNKNRIGYGKGYYDKFFELHQKIPMNKIALTYDFQVVEELPVTKNDIKMDQIITQTNMIL